MKLRDDQKLATFKCDRAKWKEFIETAAENGTTGAGLLKWFVESYLAGKVAPDVDQIPPGLEERIEELIAPLKSKIEDLELRLGKSRGERTGLSTRNQRRVSLNSKRAFPRMN